MIGPSLMISLPHPPIPKTPFPNRYLKPQKAAAPTKNATITALILKKYKAAKAYAPQR